MHYSYGDSSASPFVSNFLEFLRDSLDFSVYLLEADQRIRGTKKQRLELERRTEQELEQLEALRRAATSAIEAAPKGAPDSPAVECAARMATVCNDSVDASVASVGRKLSALVAETEAHEASEREGCVKALLGLLASHTAPQSSSVRRARLREAARYEVVLEGEWPGVGLSWTSELAIPDAHPFKQPLRVEALRHGMEISAPDQTGWLKKEVKMRPQHLERHAIDEVIVDGTKTLLRVRTEPGGNNGFDFESDAQTGRVGASRVIAGEDGLVGGPFELEPHDVPKVKELCELVRDHLAALKPTQLREAKLGDVEFRALPSFVDACERLVGNLAPFVNEIAKHSLEPDELVLRRPLGNDRREEIFVSKTTLRKKYEHLSPELNALFAPLGLNASLSRSLPPASPSTPAKRSELSRSNPPPPPVKSVPVAPVPAAPRAMAGALTEQGDRPSNALTPPLGLPASLPLALKKLMDLGKAGRLEEVFSESLVLLESKTFAEYPASDQRHALGIIMLLGKQATPSELSRRALGSARDCAHRLVARFGVPADYEMLGLLELALDESAAAAATFRKGLELEQARNPRSELCVRLAQHVA